MIKVVIADEHVPVREMLRQILSDSGDMEIVAESGSEVEMLKQLYQHDCDILLLDISIARRPLPDLIKEVKAARPEHSILVLSAYHEAQYEKHVLRSGACGYLAKPEASEKLQEMVRSIVGSTI